MKKKAIALLMLMLFLVTGCVNTAGPKTTPAESQPTMQDAWTFETKELMSGAILTDAILQESSLTMVNFWGTFCQPCIKEMPDLGELARENAAKDFALIGVMVDVAEEGGGADKARSIVEQTKADYPHLYGINALMTGVQNIQYVPTTIFFDRNGKVVGEPIIGVKSKAEYQKTIDAYLKEVAQ